METASVLTQDGPNHWLCNKHHYDQLLRFLWMQIGVLRWKNVNWISNIRFIYPRTTLFLITRLQCWAPSFYKSSELNIRLLGTLGSGVDVAPGTFHKNIKRSPPNSHPPYHQIADILKKICITLSNKERSPWKKVHRLISIPQCLFGSLK